MKNLIEQKLSSLSKVVSPLVVSAALCVVVGCGPRGESHTVDQIYSDARNGYNDVKIDASQEVQTALKGVSENLDKLAGRGAGGDAREISGQVADSLDSLIEKAGFTSRPAMTELINQYRTVASSKNAPPSLGAAPLKLLAARTYTLLKTEAVTTKFKL